MRRASRLVLVSVLLISVVIAVPAIVPARAETCKDAVSAQARSTAQLSDASREKRAKDKAVANWSKRVRDTYGWMYRFWGKSQEQKVDCGGTAKFKRCSVSAKPCTLW